MDERARFEDIVDAICAWHEEARASKVFSMPCVKRSGKVVFGLSRTGMVFKLTDPDVHRRALALPGAHLFDPTSIDDMVTAVEDILARPDEWSRLGTARAAHFSWDATARAHDAAYQAAVA